MNVRGGSVMNYITDKILTDSFTMEYLRFGEGKKTLVILPGLSVQSVITFAPSIVHQYERFTKDFTVYLFDRRLVLPPSYNINQMAEDTVSAFEQLGLSDIYLFGVSQGGMIAMTIAAEHSGLIKRLSLSSTAMRVDEARFGVIGKWISLAEAKDREGLYRAMAKDIFPAGLISKVENEFAMLSQTVTDAELEHFIILAKGISGFDLTNRADSIKCPVQFSYDENDDVLGADSSSELIALLGTHKGFTKKTFNGFGHVLYDTAPDFGEWMYSFFEQDSIS